MGAAYVVTIEVAPEAEERWNAWHARHHVPQLLALPGFVGAARYRDVAPAADGWARYVCRYDLADLPALERYLASSECARIRDEHIAYFGEVTRVSRQILVEVP